MKFVIKHEIPGRIRIHVVQKRMSSAEADTLALLGYLVVGAMIPIWNGKKGADEGMQFRNLFGDLNSFILDSLRGLDETIQYNRGEERMTQMAERSKNLG